MSSFLNIANRVPHTFVEGPGWRYALWVQGCDLGCPSCCNQTLLPFVRRHVMSSSEITLEIIQAREIYGIEGVTFLGGEPAYQARGLAEVATFCQSERLSVMMFTGFRLEQLRKRNLPGVEQLLKNTDVLVDGPYVAAQAEPQRNWVGSENQVFHYFTNRYDASIETSIEGRPALEVRFELDARLGVNGFPLMDPLD